MRRLMVVGIVALAALIPVAGHSEQRQIIDPSAHGLIRLEPLVLGSETDSSSMEPREYKLKVGQGYRWKIKASDQSEYALVGPSFFRNIWIRKL